MVSSQFADGLSGNAVKNLLFFFWFFKSARASTNSEDDYYAQPKTVSPLTSILLNCDNCSDLIDRKDEAAIFEDDLNGLDIFFTFFLASVIVASVLGNGIIGLVLYRKRSLSPSSRLVFSLCSSNLAMSFFVMPFSLASSVLQAWIFGQCWCWISAFIIHLVVSASNLTLAAIAVDRYFAIVKPMSYASTITSAKSVLVLLGIWSLSIIINLPPLFRWPQILYEPSLSVCLANLEENSIYSSFLLFWTIFLPAVIMTSSYGCIFKVARSKYRKVHIGTVSGVVRQCDHSIHASMLPSTQTATTITATPQHPQPDISMGKHPHYNNPLVSRHYVRKPSWLSIVLQSPVKGFAVICCILGVFYLCWTPYVISTLAVCNHVLFKSSWQPRLAYYLLILSIPSYPIIYGLLNRSIRKDLASYWWKTSSQGHQPSNSAVKSQLKTPVSNSTSNSSSSSTALMTVGLLDYTPPFSKWPTFNHSNSEKLPESRRKSSDDSGRFSLPSDDNYHSIYATGSGDFAEQPLEEQCRENAPAPDDVTMDTESQTNSETELVRPTDDRIENESF